jgi:protein-disulfide isomerase
LLLQQPFYEVSKSDSQIFFGNPDAKLKITILTNPFCNPCAKMHARVEKLLKETKGNVCIQYIFSSFHESLDYANKYMIAIYLQNLPPLWEGQGKVAWQLYTDWFDKGKSLKEAFFKDLQLDMTNPAIEAEFQKHESWKAKTQLRATPTIIVNGYKLPGNYKIEDLRYFTEFIVDNK